MQLGGWGWGLRAGARYQVGRNSRNQALTNSTNGTSTHGTSTHETSTDATPLTLHAVLACRL